MWTLDTSGCVVCDDAVCSDGETAVTCPEDCGVVDVAAGATHSCAVLADGTVWCWGARDSHRMGGTGDVSEPVILPGVNAAVAVTAGRHHTCIRTVLYEILCWGANGYGQVGEDPSHEVFPPVSMGTGMSVHTGAYHTCVRRSPQETACWGRLWVGATTGQNPLLLPGVGHLVLGQHHTCYSIQGHLICMGRNTSGQLGLGDKLWREVALQVTFILMVALAAGAHHTCGSISWGTDAGLLCWGDNEFGQLGIPPGPDRTEPHWVSMLVPQLLSAGLRHTCAKVSPLARPMLCWGNNAAGQRGDGTTDDNNDPPYAWSVIFSAPTSVSSIATGNNHTCAIGTDGRAYCWGRNFDGELGFGTAGDDVPVPTLVVDPYM